MPCAGAGLIRAYFYPRPPRGGRPAAFLHTAAERAISIHALREEGDRQMQPSRAWASRISIHALREEGDGSPAGRKNVV